MLRSIGLKNFKLFEHLHLDFDRLNLFTGVNGMGKSSVIQALLLLRQSFLRRELESGGLLLKGSYVDLGTGRDVFSMYASEADQIEFSLTEEQQTFEWTFRYSPGTDLLPVASGPEADFSGLALFGWHFKYLNAEHIAPRVVYEKSESEVVNRRQLGMRGEYAAHFLLHFQSEKIRFSNLVHPAARSDILLHQVDAWMGEISPGTQLVLQDVAGADLVRLAFKFKTEVDYTNECKAPNVGFGLSYALPVVVALLSATPGELLILENPESHVHPRGQAALGRLMGLCASNDVQLLVETHSDHIVNGIRVAVKRGEIDHGAVRLHYFERAQSIDRHIGTSTAIQIDSRGELSDYPAGFLDEWGNQLAELI